MSYPSYMPILEANGELSSLWFCVDVREWFIRQPEGKNESPSQKGVDVQRVAVFSSEDRGFDDCTYTTSCNETSLFIVFETVRSAPLKKMKIVDKNVRSKFGGFRPPTQNYTLYHYYCIYASVHERK
jgi:hypothetical protein